jgi:ribosomal-protein-alanine acetyltransferase
MWPLDLGWNRLLLGECRIRMPAALRLARPSDIDRLLALENAAFSGDRIGRASFRRFLAGGTAQLIVAERRGGVAGYALVLFRRGSDKARLYSVAVAPDARGAGVGVALLTAAERAAGARGCASLRLEVREDNAPAIALYRRYGFRPFARVPGYYEDGAAALRFEKDLAGCAKDMAPIRRLSQDVREDRLR